MPKPAKKNRAAWGQMIEDYLVGRENLQLVFVLIDSRLEPQKIDLEFINWLGASGIPFALIFTKADKQSTNKTQQNIARFKKALKETWEDLPTIFSSSAETGAGRDELSEYIEVILNN
uniref:GTP-binding protein n=1 Tax=Roseivirga sp. TaxID=1964215 RepID=UPI004047958F